MAKVNYTNTKLQTHEYIIQIDIVGVVYYMCEWGYGVTCTVHSPIYVRLVFGSRSTIVQ